MLFSARQIFSENEKIMETRLTYNCAHLRSMKESLTIFWVKIIWVKIFFSENFLGENLFWVKILGGDGGDRGDRGV